jgi:hypothetical protein
MESPTKPPVKEAESSNPEPEPAAPGPASATPEREAVTARTLLTPKRLAVVVNRSYQLWLLTKARFSPTERQRLFGLTIAIGGVCGLVAVSFHESIRWVGDTTSASILRLMATIAPLLGVIALAWTASRMPRSPDR